MNRNTKRLQRLLIFFCIGIVALIVMQYKGVFTKEKKVFSKRDLQNVVTVTIINEAQKEQLYLKNGLWYRQNGASREQKIDTKRIQGLFTTILGLNKNEIVSTSKTKYEQFDVMGRKRIELELKNGAFHLPGKKPKKLILYIGTVSPTEHTYFRANTDPVVYATPVDLSNVITTP